VHCAQFVADAGNRFDEDPTSVGRVGDSTDIAGLLESIDHPRRRAGRQAGQLGESSNRQGAFYKQPVEALDISARETETVRYGKAEQSRLTSHAAGRLEQLG
jgi:hypothetical protein